MGKPSAQGGLFKYSVDEMVPELRPGVRYLLMGLYGIMTLAFFIAVIAYGVVNGIPLLSGGGGLEAPVVTTPTAVLDYPAVTLCPVDSEINITGLNCFVLQGDVQTASCIGSLVPLTVSVQGTPFNCVQYNSGSTPVVQATSLTNTLVVQATIDIIGIDPGESIGAYVFVTPQYGTPGLGFSNTFVATPGFMQLILLNNYTTFSSSGARSVAFQAAMSKAPLRVFNASQTVQTMEIQLVYPQMVSYVQNQLNSAFVQLSKGRFIAEAGGLAALLLFLHRIVMWIVTCPLYFCCREDTGGPRGGARGAEATMQSL